MSNYANAHEAIRTNSETGPNTYAIATAILAVADSINNLTRAVRDTDTTLTNIHNTLAEDAETDLTDALLSLHRLNEIADNTARALTPTPTCACTALRPPTPDTLKGPPCTCPTPVRHPGNICGVCRQGHHHWPTP